MLTGNQTRYGVYVSQMTTDMIRLSLITYSYHRSNNLCLEHFKVNLWNLHRS